MNRALEPAFRAWKFPSSASLRICLSKVSSATGFFKRPFSFSRSFMRRACSSLRPLVLTAPAVITLFEDAQHSADLADPLALSQLDFRLPQQPNDLLRVHSFPP